MEGQWELQVTVLLGASCRSAHLLVQLGAVFLRTLALLLGLSAQGGGGDFEAGQPLDQLFGLGGRHLTDGQGGDFLQGGRLRALLGQTQQRVGGEAPFATAFAVAPGALNANGAEASLDGCPVAVGPAAESVLTVRTQRRRHVGF